MLVIRCPWCGVRNESEFVNGGPKKPRRPDNAADLSDAAWVDRLTVGPNPKGPLLEKWWHLRGCGRWFTLTRDTLTHEVGANPPDARDGG